MYFFSKKIHLTGSDICDRIHGPAIALGERTIMWQLCLQKKISDSVKKSLQGTHLSAGDPQNRVKYGSFRCSGRPGPAPGAPAQAKCQLILVLPRGIRYQSSELVFCMKHHLTLLGNAQQCFQLDYRGLGASRASLSRPCRKMSKIIPSCTNL